jgi:hypothetical protein
MLNRILITLFCLLLTGCGPVTTFMLVGNVVNAAGHAYTDRPEYWQQKKLEEAETFTEEYYRELAENDNPSAQFELGLYYLYERKSDAYYWICRSANKGYGRAQMQMGHFYNKDRQSVDSWPEIKTSLDDRVAFVWYSLAENTGEEDARLYRIRLIDGRMSDDRIEEAENMLASWQPVTCGKNDYTIAREDRNN